MRLKDWPGVLDGLREIIAKRGSGTGNVRALDSGFRYAPPE